MSEPVRWKLERYFAGVKEDRLAWMVVEFADNLFHVWAEGDGEPPAHLVAMVAQLDALRVSLRWALAKAESLDADFTQSRGGGYWCIGCGDGVKDGRKRDHAHDCAYARARRLAGL